jgi:hypothetical protein
MKVREIKAEQLVPQPLEEVFSFFAKPENLARLTPKSLGFIILTPQPITMKAGAIIDYTIKVFGMRQRWRTLIETYEPPHRFIDIQLNGPYTLWHHTHAFEQHEGGTLITDHVRFVLPFGWLGDLAHFLMVRRQLQRIFSYREAVISELFGEQRAENGW